MHQILSTLVIKLLCFTFYISNQNNTAKNLLLSKCSLGPGPFCLSLYYLVGVQIGPLFLSIGFYTKPCCYKQNLMVCVSLTCGFMSLWRAPWGVWSTAISYSKKAHCPRSIFADSSNDIRPS